MTSQRLRVAVVGCGQMAPVHCRYLQQLPEVELVAVCAPSPRNREHLAEQFRIPSYADIGQMLQAAHPDVAHLVTPPATHAPLAIQLLEAGVHVLVEKPMALNTVEADAMIDAAQRAGRWLTVNHVRWFDPVVERGRRLLESGSLGRLVGVEVFQGAVAREEQLPPGPHTEWKAALPGGILFNLAPHPAYLLCGFIGAAETVHAIGHSDGGGRLREVRAVVKGGRALGSLTVSLDSQPFTKRIVLYGSERIAEIDLNNIAVTTRKQRSVPRLAAKVLPNVEQALRLLACTLGNGIEFLRGRYQYYPGMGRHFQALYRAALRGEPPPVSLTEAREVVRIVEEMWRQAGVVTQPVNGRNR